MAKATAIPPTKAPEPGPANPTPQNADGSGADPAKLEPGEKLPGASGANPLLNDGSKPVHLGDEQVDVKPAIDGPAAPPVGDAAAFREAAGIVPPEKTAEQVRRERSRLQTSFQEKTALPRHVVGAAGDGTDITVKDAATMVREFIAAVRAGDVWTALRIAGDLLKIGADMGFLQGMVRADHEGGPEDWSNVKADFAKACDELHACREHAIGNASRIVAGFQVSADSGSPAPIAAVAPTANGPMKTLNPNDFIQLYELVTSAVSLIRRLLG